MLGYIYIIFTEISQLLDARQGALGPHNNTVQ